MSAIQHYIENFGFSLAILFSKAKGIPSCVHITLVTPVSETNPTVLIFLGIFVAAPSQN
jgi:hypothetical protein